MVVSGNWFDVVKPENDSEDKYIGRGVAEQKVVLTGSTYAPFNFTLDRGASTSTENSFECNLVLNRYLSKILIPMPIELRDAISENPPN
jgi:hypothetical protein